MMDFEVTIHTSFSVFDPTAKGFRMTRALSETPDEYLKTLFAEDRLASKFRAFETLTLPSILSQTWPKWTWFVYCSTALPPKYYERLCALCAADPRIKVLQINRFSEMSRNIAKTTTETVITARLDDDDAIHSSVLERIVAVASGGLPVGAFIGITSGVRVAILEDGKVLAEASPAEFHPAVLALGLSRIGASVYNGESHFEIHKNPSNVVAYVTEPCMFLLSTGSACDTGRRFNACGAKEFDVGKWLGSTS